MRTLGLHGTYTDLFQSILRRMIWVVISKYCKQWKLWNSICFGKASHVCVIIKLYENRDIYIVVSWIYQTKATTHLQLIYLYQVFWPCLVACWRHGHALTSREFPPLNGVLMIPSYWDEIFIGNTGFPQWKFVEFSMVFLSWQDLWNCLENVYFGLFRQPFACEWNSRMMIIYYSHSNISGYVNACRLNTWPKRSTKTLKYSLK